MCLIMFITSRLDGKRSLGNETSFDLLMIAAHHRRT